MPPEVEAEARQTIPQRTSEYSISTNGPARVEARRVPVLALSPQISLRSERSLQETAADSLARIGAPAVPEVSAMLNAEEPAQRIRAAHILAQIGPEAKLAAPALIARLSDPDVDVRKAAAHALGQLGPEAAAAVPELLRAAQE